MPPRNEKVVGSIPTGGSTPDQRGRWVSNRHVQVVPPVRQPEASTAAGGPGRTDSGQFRRS